MNKNYMLFVLLICINNVLFAQIWERLNIEFKISDEILINAMAGGLQAPQFSEIDLNNDGILDLYVFERLVNMHLCFINNGAPNTIDYTYAPQYESIFPEIESWILLRDYNHDGIQDIFAYYFDSELLLSGVQVYKGKYEDDNLQFEFVDWQQGATPLLYYTQNGNTELLSIDPSGYPAIDDIDGDGDLDILSFDKSSGFYILFNNESIESGFGTDSLLFSLADECWGRFLESGTEEGIILSDGTELCAEQYLLANQLHGGSTLLTFDPDYDGDKELLMGNAASTNFYQLNYLFNGGNSQNAWMVSTDTFLPGDDFAVNINYPASFYLDVNNDGKKDIVSNPYLMNNENRSVWWYENIGNESQDIFDFQQTDFLLDNILDFGSSVYPVFVDFNQDGLIDLVVGTDGEYIAPNEQYSRLILFKNIGTAFSPVFVLEDNDYLNFSQFNDLSRLYIPAFGDLDSDGDLDLVVGEADGSLFYAENLAGANAIFDFGEIITNYKNINVGNLVAPQIIDLNRDGLQDLVLGEWLGNLNFFPNVGTPEAAHFEASDTADVNNNFLGEVDTRIPFISLKGASKPFFVDINGNFELYTGSEYGIIEHYTNIDNDLEGAFDIISENVLGIDIGERTAPAFADIDNDGLYEAIIGNVRGGLSGFQTDIPVGIVDANESVEQKYNIEIYPNPSNRKINIESTIGIESIDLLDLQGQNLFHQQYQSLKYSTQIFLGDLPKGIYFLEIKGERSLFVKKIIL